MVVHSPGLGALGATLALLGVGAVTGLGERVDGIIRVVAVFYFLGTAVAYRRSQRRPDSDPFPIISRWSFIGFAAGLLLEAVGGLP